MQEQFFTQFIQLFQQAFLNNLDGFFPLFSGYASGLFYGLAAIELVIAGLLIALSSSTTIYTLLTRLIKISIFFFLVFHFGDLFQLMFNSIKYIATHAQTSTGVLPGTSDLFKLSSLWDFNHPDNYVTRGLSQVFNNFSSLHTTVQNIAPHTTNNTINNTTRNQAAVVISTITLLQYGQIILLALTAILAVVNIVLFYFSALVALLLSPFGQISVSAGFFQAAFSKFISAGLRLMVFTLVFILFSLFYTKLAQSMPDLLLTTSQATFHTLPLSGSENLNHSQSMNLASLSSFLMTLLGLCLCWFIPREISQHAGSFLIPEIPPETRPVTTTALPAIQDTTSAFTAMQAYTIPDITLSPITLQTNPATQTTIGTPPATSAIHATAPQVTTIVSAAQMSFGASSTGKSSYSGKNNSLRKQTRFIQQRFTRERAAKLRQNFHKAMEKSEK